MKTSACCAQLACLLACLLAACGPQLEGEYRDSEGGSGFRLANGKYLKTHADGSLVKFGREGHLPLPVASPYKVAGATLVVDGAPNRAQFIILPDGRLKLSQDGRELIFVRK